MFRKILVILSSLILLGTIIGYFAYTWIFWSNTQIEHDFVLFIPSESTYSEVMDSLNTNQVLKRPFTFDMTALLMKYNDGAIHPGRYLISPGESNRQIIRRLRIGDRSPIMVTISTGRTMEDIYSALATQLEADSLQLAKAFEDSTTIAEMGFSPSTLISMIIPNSYEMHWNSSPSDLVQRMKREYDKFWAMEDRMTKCGQLGMGLVECSTLASIVEKETNITSEKPTVAGVYLNRIQRGIPLQADPTVVFAVGDFEIRRVLNKHLAYDSPYNTYMYPGLPPGPICLPSISSIDAVLNAENHDYIFFCAKPGYSGGHAFARTNREHENNARIYRSWLDSQNIKS